MNNNGNRQPPDDKLKPTPSTGPQTDEERVDLTLRDIQDTEHYQPLSDLELLAEILEDKSLSHDPRVHELMSRLYPDWANEPDFEHLPEFPRFINIAVPYQVAYNVATFSHCRCLDSIPPDNAAATKPCMFCATRSALYRATKNPIFQPDDDIDDDDSKQ